MVTVTTYWWVYRVSLRRFVEYRGDFMFDLLGKLFVPLVVQLVLWTAIFRSAAESVIGGYEYEPMMRYVVLSLFISTMMKVERIEKEIAASIRDGELSRFLIKPIDFMAYQFSVFLADVTPVFIGSVILFGMGMISGWLTTPLPLMISGWITILIGMYLAYMMGFLVALFAFVMDEIWTLFVMKNLLFWFITGQFIPLDFLPRPLFEALTLLPFQYLSYFPAKCFLGALSAQAGWMGVGHSALWAVVFWGMYRMVWHLALRRFGAYGG